MVEISFLYSSTLWSIQVYRVNETTDAEREVVNCTPVDYHYDPVPWASEKLVNGKESKQKTPILIIKSSLYVSNWKL